MATGIIVNGLFLPRVSLPSLESKLEDCNEDIKASERRLLALAAQPPTVNTDSEGNNIPWHEWVTGEVEQILADYKDTITTQYLVAQALHTLSFDPDDVQDEHFEDGGEQWKIKRGFKKEAKPGPAIPEGWERATEGWASCDTMIWENGQWINTPAMGNPVEMYACVIRKLKHGPIPEGWGVVTGGVTTKGDALWYPSMGIWARVSKVDASLGEDIKQLNTVIRKLSEASPDLPEDTTHIKG